MDKWDAKTQALVDELRDQLATAKADWDLIDKCNGELLTQVEELQMSGDILRDIERHHHDLLARVHRDGGHYLAQHGVEKATLDADKIVASLWGDLDEIHVLARSLNGILREK